MASTLFVEEEKDLTYPIVLMQEVCSLLICFQLEKEAEWKKVSIDEFRAYS